MDFSVYPTQHPYSLPDPVRYIRFAISIDISLEKAIESENFQKYIGLINNIVGLGGPIHGPGM